jgi:hypothetical protein
LFNGVAAFDSGVAALFCHAAEMPHRRRTPWVCELTAQMGALPRIGPARRHSILAVGTGKDGQLQVIDSWDGQKKSLDDALKTYPVKNPSFDYAYSMRNKSEPELNLNR